MEVFIPSRWVGFGVVVAMVAVHLAVVISTTIWLARRSQYTVLGNSWQTVAQMQPDHLLRRLPVFSMGNLTQRCRLLRDQPVLMMGRLTELFMGRGHGGDIALFNLTKGPWVGYLGR